MQRHTCNTGGSLGDTTSRKEPGSQSMASLMGPLMGTGTCDGAPAGAWGSTPGTQLQAASRPAVRCDMHV
jgi:hypothetical protein